MIVRNSMLLAFFGAFSILLGIVRDRLLSEFVGVGPTLDVYNAAFRIPDLTLAIMLSFASATTVVPFLTSAVHKEDEKDLRRRFSSLFLFFGGSMVVLGIIVVALLPFFAPFVVPGFSSEQTRLFVYATSILMLQPLLLGLSTLISGLAQVRHQFFVYSIAPLFYTAVIIYSVTLYPSHGFGALILGVVVGAIFHLLIQSYTLWKQKLSVSISSFDFELVKEHLRFATPRSGSYIISRTRDIIFASVATTFGPGALSVYVFAQRVIDAFIQVIVQSISSATLPRLSLHHTKGESEIFIALVKKSITIIFVIACGMSTFIYFFKGPLLTLLYGSHAPIESIGNMLLILSIGLPLFAMNYYFVSAFNAAKNNKILFFANLISTTVAMTSLYLMKREGYGLYSIGYANMIISALYLAVLVIFYRKKLMPNAS